MGTVLGWVLIGVLSGACLWHCLGGTGGGSEVSHKIPGYVSDIFQVLGTHVGTVLVSWGTGRYWGDEARHWGLTGTLPISFFWYRGTGGYWGLLEQLSGDTGYWLVVLVVLGD